MVKRIHSAVQCEHDRKQKGEESSVQRVVKRGRNISLQANGNQRCNQAAEACSGAGVRGAVPAAPAVGEV